MGVLWYLADEANLLHMNRQHIMWLRRPERGRERKRRKRSAANPLVLARARNKETPPPTQSWDPLRFPAADAAGMTGLWSRLPLLASIMHIQASQHAQSTPAQVDFEEFTAPRFAHQSLGQAAVDVQHAKFGMSIPVAPAQSGPLEQSGTDEQDLKVLGD